MSIFTRTLSLGLLALTAGCIDEGTKEDCVGLSCLNGSQWPDGGEIRLQYILMPDGTHWTRATALFMSHQNPEMTPMLPLGRCRQIDPLTDLQTADREYIYVGDTVTFDLGDMEIMATLQGQPDDGNEQVIDHIGRSHDFYYHVDITEDRPDDFFNTFHYAATAEDVSFSEKLSQAGIFLGPRQNIINPAGPSIELTRGEPFEFVWEQVVPFQEGIAHAGTLLWQSGNDRVMCIPTDNRFTMTPEYIDLLAGDSGLMLLGNATNEAILTDEGRMINVYGIYCHMYPWTIVD